MISKSDNDLGGYFKFFYSYIGYRFFIVIGLSITVGFLDGIGLTMLIPLLQSLEGGVNSNTAQLGQLNHIIYFLKGIGLQMTVNVVLSIFISLFIFKGIFRLLEQIYHLRVHLLFMRKTQYNLLNNLKDISYKGFLELDAGKIQNTFIAEVYRISQSFKNYLKWSQALVMVITYISLAFLANYKFTFLVVGSSLITNIFYSSLNKKIKLASYEISKTGHNLNAYMIEIIHYFKYLKSTNYLPLFSKKIKSIINIRQDINWKTGLYSAISISIKEPIIVFIVSMVIFIQLNLIGGSLGSIILSLLLFYRGLNYLLTIQKEWQNFIMNSGAIQNVCEVSERMQELKEVAGNRKFEAINNFGYGSWILIK